MFRLPWRAIRNGSSRGRPRASRIARCRQGGAIRSRKPPPPAPSSLPPMAPARRAAVVPLVDLVVADPAAQRSLQLPPLVQQVREPVEVPLAGQGVPHLVGQVAHRAEHVHAVHRRVGLPLQDRVGVSRLAGVEQEDPLLQFRQRLGPAGDRLDVDRVVRVEPDVVQPAEGRRVLVLAADRLAAARRSRSGRPARPGAGG